MEIICCWCDGTIDNGEFVNVSGDRMHTDCYDEYREEMNSLHDDKIRRLHRIDADYNLVTR